MTDSPPRKPIQPIRALRAIRELLRNPDDTEQVFEIIDALSGNVGERLYLRFVGTETGIFVSLNDGRNWQRMQGGLPVVPVYDLKLKGSDLRGDAALRVSSRDRCGLRKGELVHGFRESLSRPLARCSGHCRRELRSA